MTTTEKVSGAVAGAVAIAAVFLAYTWQFQSTVADYKTRLASCRGPIFRIPLTKADIGSYQAVTSDMNGQIYMLEPYVPPSKRFVMRNADSKVRKGKKKRQ